jgi:hypothetical protein
MKCTIRSSIVFTAALMLGGMTVSSFAADGDFNKDHPRRAEVNQRLNNQDKRINKEVKEGDMSKAKAARLHRKDRKIRKEERRMAAKDGGHITKVDQQKLNRQENGASKQIGK